MRVSMKLSLRDQEIQTEEAPFESKLSASNLDKIEELKVSQEHDDTHMRSIKSVVSNNGSDRSKLRNLQEQLKALNEEIVNLKIENRVMKKKLDGKGIVIS